MKAKHALLMAARSALTALVLLCPAGEVTGTSDLEADQERLDQARRALQAGRAETVIMRRVRDAMKKAVESGRLAFEAGRIPRQPYATASTPVEGVVKAGS